jgi:hypothetical protein
MSNDNPTRIIRTERDQDAFATSNATRKISAAGARAEPEDSPKTRVISSRGGGARSEDSAGDVPDDFELAAGWLVIIDGPGRGVTREIYYGMNSVGRGQGERISLDFGDTSISREAHAYIVFDEKKNDFYIQHGGKSNLVRLNDAPVLAPIQMKKGDIIEIGATRVMFVPLCGDDFSWNGQSK